MTKILLMKPTPCTYMTLLYYAFSQQTQISQNHRIFAMHFFYNFKFNFISICWSLTTFQSTIEVFCPPMRCLKNWNPATKPVLDTDLQSLPCEQYIQYWERFYKNMTHQKQFRKRKGLVQSLGNLYYCIDK